MSQSLSLPPEAPVTYALGCCACGRRMAYGGDIWLLERDAIGVRLYCPDCRPESSLPVPDTVVSAPSAAGRTLPGQLP